MRPGPLTLLGIVDHAIETGRRHSRFVFLTIVIGSIPFALGLAVGVHLIRVYGGDPLHVAAGAVALALLSGVRAVGWGAGIVGLRSILDDEPLRLGAAWKQARSRWLRLYSAQVWPLAWSLFGFFVSVGPLVLGVLMSNAEGRIWASGGIVAASSTLGTLAALLALVYVSRRTVAVPIAAVDDPSEGGPLARSRRHLKQRTVRALMLHTLLLVLHLIAWLTAVLAAPSILHLASVLTGHAFLELRGVLAWQDPSYLAFTGALAFLLMEPLRCLSAGLLHQDGETRRSGADLKARLEREAQQAAAAGETP